MSDSTTKRIYKYPLPVVDDPDIAMPEGARMLTVQTHGGQPFIWALVDTDADMEPRGFRVLWTGHPFPDAERWPIYVGTFQLAGGGLVFHVFAREQS